ncbi:hypothetical protein JHL18_02515 [Clostridium sp. YIM B02505]|uniref:Uncharacterized protein n=1 Tax=Clostridium yunnanense TaxID=2800325 RepID=A0ABS1EJK8_9CLOT|nr:hypothetical protein [Clostridium yunnanense]MBK1809518.1 hypothetical protein [Clostridium yunnanense]
MKSKIIFGSIVAQTDNIYFISKFPERRLITLKTLDIKSYPCDEFKIADSPTKFYLLKNEFLNENIKLKDGSEIKFKENETDKDQNFNYTWVVESTNLEIDLSVAYSIGKDGKVDSFKFDTSKKLKSKTVFKNVDDEQTVKFADNYKTFIMQYFNLIKPEESNLYYYDNYVLKYQLEDHDGLYKESYTVIKVDNLNKG